MTLLRKALGIRHMTVIVMAFGLMVIIPSLFKVLSHANSISLTQSNYPWDNSFYKRSEELLHHMRKNLEIEILGTENMVKSFQDTDDEGNTPEEGDGKLIVKNLEGIPFIASLKVVDPNVLKQKNLQYLYDPDLLSAKIGSLCSVLPENYWNYEWCHRKHINQFHIEQDGKKVTKSPNWSLGKYTRTVVVRDRADVGNEKTPIVKLVDYFEGGQLCHENNHKRSMEVHIQCCDGLGIANAIPSEAYYSQQQQQPHNSGQRSTPNSMLPMAMLNAIHEPELCHYHATVCTPLLCQQQNAYSLDSNLKATGEGEAVPISSQKRAAPKYSDILKLINETCLIKSEEWWTYEICLNKWVRQVRFNLEQSVTAEGTIVQKQVLANQFILGTAPLSLYKNESSLIQSISSKSANKHLSMSTREKEILDNVGLPSPLFRTRGKDPNFLTLTFTNGTPCDLDNINRSTIVEIYCGMSNSFVQVREDSTCQYRAKIELTAICVLPGFAPVKENITSIVLTPLFDPEKSSKKATKAGPAASDQEEREEYNTNQSEQSEEIQGTEAHEIQVEEADRNGDRVVPIETNENMREPEIVEVEVEVNGNGNEGTVMGVVLDEQNLEGFNLQQLEVLQELKKSLEDELIRLEKNKAEKASEEEEEEEEDTREQTANDKQDQTQLQEMQAVESILHRLANRIEGIRELLDKSDLATATESDDEGTEGTGAEVTGKSKESDGQTASEGGPIDRETTIYQAMHDRDIHVQ